MLCLGFESSCDETAVALYDTHRGLLSHQIFSQVDLHAVYGGVVPELAARDHVQRMLPLLKASLSESHINLNEIDGVAYTKGPGLVGALLVGAVFAKTLAWSLDIPALGIHHLEAHLMAAQLDERPPTYPYLGVLVSGGHSLIIAVESMGSYRILGQSVDDAVGEAFDKVAKLLGLGYPGGPAVERIAKSGHAARFDMPRPMIHQKNGDLSFSGLKTHVMQLVAQLDPDDQQAKADIAAGFQAAAIDCLLIKSKRALSLTGYSSVVIAGGVSANQALRQACLEHFGPMGIDIFFPKLQWCTDNAAMVAITGSFRLPNEYDVDADIQVLPRWPLESLSAVP